MAGPTPPGVALFRAQADYKEAVDLKSCLSEFHHKILWCGLQKPMIWH